MRAAHAALRQGHVAMLTPSVWSERLDPRIHRFASRLDWIGRTIRKYNEMLAMLGSNIPNPSFEIYYEKLTTVARIITFFDTYCAFFTSGHLDSDNG